MSNDENRILDLEARVKMLEDRVRRLYWGQIVGDKEARRVELLERYGETVGKTEAAGILGVTRATVYNMIADGRIQSGCGGKRVSVRSIADYMEKAGK